MPVLWSIVESDTGPVKENWLKLKVAARENHYPIVTDYLEENFPFITLVLDSEGLVTHLSFEKDEQLF